MSEQVHSLSTSLAKTTQALRRLSIELLRPDCGLKEVHLRNKIKRWLAAAQFLDELIGHELKCQDGRWRLQFDVDTVAFNRLMTRRLGRTILMTNRTDWTADQVVAAYGGQQQVEKVFRGLKDGDWLGWGQGVVFEEGLPGHGTGAARATDAPMQAASRKLSNVSAIKSSRGVEIPSGLIVWIGIFSHPGQDIADGVYRFHSSRRGALLPRPTGPGDREFCGPPGDLRSTRARAWGNRIECRLMPVARQVQRRRPRCYAAE